MSFHQLDLCSSDELLQKLQSKLQDKFSQFKDIFDRWSGLREKSPSKPDGYYFYLLAEEVVKVVSSLDGDFELIRNFSAILPPSHCVTCYPDATGRVQYFTLLSDHPHSGLRAEIYSASVDNSDGEAEIFRLEDLDFTVNVSNAWKEVVDRSRKEGWLRCLLDLVTWKLEYRKIEYGACGSYLRRKQIEIVKELDALPFHLHVDSDKLNVDMTARTEFGLEGTLGNLPVWVHYYSKESMGSDDEKEKALQEVLDARNLRHPNLINWSSVDSGSPDKWALVTPRLSQTLPAMLESNRGSDEFKLALIKDMASGLDYLYAKETWHGKLRLTNVLVASPSSPRDRRFVLSGFVPLTRAGPLEDAYRNRNVKGEFISREALDDVKDFGKILYDLYPDELAYDSHALKVKYKRRPYIDPNEATPDDLVSYLIAKSLYEPKEFPCSRIGRYIYRTCVYLAAKNAMDSEQLAASTTPSNAMSQQEVQSGDLPASSMETQEINSSSGSAATSPTPVEPPAPPFRSAQDVIKEKRMSRKPSSPTPVSSKKPKSKGIGRLFEKLGLKGPKAHREATWPIA